MIHLVNMLLRIVRWVVYRRAMHYSRLADHYQQLLWDSEKGPLTTYFQILGIVNGEYSRCASLVRDIDEFMDGKKGREKLYGGKTNEVSEIHKE